MKRAFALLLLLPIARDAAGDATKQALAAAVAEPSFPTVHYTLANGLEVILQPDPSVTTAVVDLWYRVGSKDEQVGHTGFAHLFEHLMFEGSKHVKTGDFDRLLETAGAWNNADTTTDRTNYIEQVPSNFLELALYLEADRMAGLWDAMDQTVLDAQRAVVENEVRQQVWNTPYGKAEIALEEALWPAGHGYHHHTYGSMDDLDHASLADVEAFWRRWYLPSNATLVIVGDIDVDATRTLIDRYFAWMPKTDRPAGLAYDGKAAPRDGALDLTATDTVEAAKVIVAWRTEPANTASASDLGVASTILGGGNASRLYRRLVFQDRLATEVYAYLDERVLGGTFQIEAVVRDGVDPAKVKAAILDEVGTLRDRGPTADEVERAQRVTEASMLAGLENIASRAAAIATWNAQTGDPDHLGAELDQLRAVTMATVQASATAWLGAGAAVTMTVTPAKAASGGAK